MPRRVHFLQTNFADHLTTQRNCQIFLICPGNLIVYESNGIELFKLTTDILVVFKVFDKKSRINSMNHCR